jgi:GNAT superfamily N-acetyltransferase
MTKHGNGWSGLNAVGDAPPGNGSVEISTDRSRLDRQLIHAFLSEESYWARGIPVEIVERSIEHSLNFGLYAGDDQLAYARVITDRATFALVRDVFVVECWRGRGLGTLLMQAVLDHPDLQGLRRVLLVTRDAAPFYRSLGFKPLTRPDRFLAIERRSKELYPR